MFNRDRLNDALKGVPEHIREGLRDHVLVGRPTGSFLTAVLENDLTRAATRADTENSRRLADIARFLFNDVPGECWGSPEKVRAWIEAGGVEGLEGKA